MPWMPACPSDVGVFHGPLDPIAIVTHRTYGAWGGDYSVGKQGIFHFLIGKNDGNWVQFAPTDVVQYHCNGANFTAVGIEIEGTNEDDLTPWQSARLGDVLQWLHATHGIPLDYLDPNSVAPASVHVNDGNFRGVISHVSVMTDDGSQQHTDEISVAAFNAAVNAQPAPAPPAPRTQGSKMEIIVGSLPKDSAWGSPDGAVPIPANDAVALLVQGSTICGSWAEAKAQYGVPSGAKAWADAHPGVEIWHVDAPVLAAVLHGHNKLVA